MPELQKEIQLRQDIALNHIVRMFGSEQDEFGATLFVKHHLEELDASYWQKHLGTEKPEPTEVIKLLILDSHWSEDDDEGLEYFDFTLPDEITDYLISVRFNSSSEVISVAMES